MEDAVRALHITAEAGKFLDASFPGRKKKHTTVP